MHAKPLTPERLAEIRARLDAATTGPWWYNEEKCWRPGENGAKPVLTDQEAVFYAGGAIALQVLGAAG